MPSPAQILISQAAESPRIPATAVSRQGKLVTMPNVRGEVARALYDATARLRKELRSSDDAKLLQALAVSVGILADKLVIVDVRCEARRDLDMDSSDLDAARARQQAIDDEIAKRKAELLRKGATDTVEITPQLLEELDNPAPAPEPEG